MRIVFGILIIIGAIVAVPSIWMAFGWFAGLLALAGFALVFFGTLALVVNWLGIGLIAAAIVGGWIFTPGARFVLPYMPVAQQYDADLRVAELEAQIATLKAPTNPAIAQPTAAPMAISPTPVALSNSGSWTPASKCSWLRANFPQTVAEIQALGIKLTGTSDLTRIRTHVYDLCGPSSTVYDGMIILGPAEGHSAEFSINVPLHGGVDTYGTAKCTGTKVELGAETDTYRCLSGKVTAVNATYWPWLDENPPVSGGVVADQVKSQTDDCIDPVELAKKNSWSYTGKPDKYGGLVVALKSDAELPTKWEAKGKTSIMESDTVRKMIAGSWTVYPPFTCRVTLGYSN